MIDNISPLNTMISSEVEEEHLMCYKVCYIVGPQSNISCKRLLHDFAPLCQVSKKEATVINFIHEAGAAFCTHCRFFNGYIFLKYLL